MYLQNISLLHMIFSEREMFMTGSVLVRGCCSHVSMHFLCCCRFSFNRELAVNLLKCHGALQLFSAYEQLLYSISMAIFLAVCLLNSQSSQIYHSIVCFMNILKFISNAQYFFESFSVTIQVKFLYQFKFVFAVLRRCVFYLFWKIRKLEN